MIPKLFNIQAGKVYVDDSSTQYLLFKCVELDKINGPNVILTK